MDTTYPPGSSSSSSAPLNPHHSLGRSSEDSFDSDQDVEANTSARGLEAKETLLYDDEDLYPEAAPARKGTPGTASTSATERDSQARSHRRSSSAAVAGDPLSLDTASGGVGGPRRRAEAHRLMDKPDRIRSKEDFGKSAIVIGCLIASWCEYFGYGTAANGHCRTDVYVVCSSYRHLLNIDKRVQQMDVGTPSSAVPLHSICELSDPSPAPETAGLTRKNATFHTRSS